MFIIIHDKDQLSYTSTERNKIMHSTQSNLENRIHSLNFYVTEPSAGERERSLEISVLSRALSNL